MRSPQKFKGIYIEETSPSNPFGPNYFALPYNAKLAYKFNKMKAFIRPNKQDLVKKQDENQKFVGTLLMGFGIGVLLGGSGKMLFKAFTPKIGEILQSFQHIYYPIIITCTTVHAYFKAYDRYYIEVNKYFIDRYLKQAIENGFEDYQISK